MASEDFHIKEAKEEPSPALLNIIKGAIRKRKQRKNKDGQKCGKAKKAPIQPEVDVVEVPPPIHDVEAPVGPLTLTSMNFITLKKDTALYNLVMAEVGQQTNDEQWSFVLS